MKELAAAAAKKDCEFLDAPVTGTKPHAAAGELFFMVGGSAAGFDRAKVVLSVLGREVVHLGPNGSGALLKLINNFVCGVQAATFAEAMSLVRASDLDREKSVSVLGNSALASPLIKRMMASMAADDFTPNFPLKLMTKDIGYAIQEGEMWSSTRDRFAGSRGIQKGCGTQASAIRTFPPWSRQSGRISSKSFTTGAKQGERLPW